MKVFGALDNKPNPMHKSEGQFKRETRKYKVCWERKVAGIIRDRLRERETVLKSGTTENESNRRLFSLNPHPPFLVGLIGIPGSGKSTSAQILSSLLLNSDGHHQDNDGDDDEGVTSGRREADNNTDGYFNHSSIGNMIVPMDGYHYPLATLRTFPNSEDVIYRRGAPDTFDHKALGDDLRRIMMKQPQQQRQQREGGDDVLEVGDMVVRIPGFDHSKGDPQPGAHTFLRDKHEVVICEGLYLLHDSYGWNDSMTMPGDGNGKDRRLFNLTVFLDTNIDDSINRLKERNACIPGYSKEEIEIRCEEVDRLNAQTVLRGRDRADLVVKSVVDT